MNIYQCTFLEQRFPPTAQPSCGNFFFCFFFFKAERITEKSLLKHLNIFLVLWGLNTVKWHETARCDHAVWGESKKGLYWARTIHTDREMWMSCMIFIIFTDSFEIYIHVQTTLNHFFVNFFIQNWFSDAAVIFFQMVPADTPTYLYTGNYPKGHILIMWTNFILYLPFPFTVYLGCKILIQMAEPIMLLACIFVLSGRI